MITLKNLVPGSQLTTGALTYYTATNLAASITNATITNTTGGAVTATVYIIPSGGTAGATNVKISARSIAAGETYLCPELIGADVMSGGIIQALASSGSALTLMISGLEVTG